MSSRLPGLQPSGTVLRGVFSRNVRIQISRGNKQSVWASARAVGTASWRSRNHHKCLASSASIQETPLQDGKCDILKERTCTVFFSDDQAKDPSTLQTMFILIRAMMWTLMVRFYRPSSDNHSGCGEHEVWRLLSICQTHFAGQA